MKLSEFCMSISDGDHLPPPKAEYGVPFVTIANIDSTNHFDFSNTMFVPQSYYDQVDDKRKAREGDVLYSVVGSFGIPVLIREERPFVFQRHIAILRPNRDVIDPRFLYYTMLSKAFFAKADAAAIGAAQRTISLTSLRNIKISVPDIKIQEQIADKLSDYDTLIENNQRQIKLLEEVAQRFYKEWFIDLRFPGCEDATIIDGTPDGWVEVPFSETVDIIGGGTPPTANPNFYNGDIPFYTPKDANEQFFAFSTLTNITSDGLNNCHSKLFPKDTVIITARGTVGKTVMLAVPMAMNQSCYAIQGKRGLSQAYIFFALKAAVAKLKAMANGGVFDTIIVKTFDQIHMWLPKQELIDSFENCIKPVLDEIKNKMVVIERLIEARNRLLPKLMSGEIEV